MNLKMYHKSQFKTAIYKLMSCPGCLTEDDCLLVLEEILAECSNEEDC